MPLKKSAKKKLDAAIEKKRVQFFQYDVPAAPLTNSQAREVLNIVVNALNQGGEGARNLWGVLSALRGPDADGSYTLKSVTTTRVRGQIGLKPYNGIYAITVSPLPQIERLTRTNELAKATWHFQKHYESAVYAIQKLFGYDLHNEKEIPG